MFVKRVGAFRRQTPEPRAKILAPGAFKIIRVRDFHQIGWTPVEIVRRNQKVTFDRFHCSFLDKDNR
jgi:hypothetical protein